MLEYEFLYYWILESRSALALVNFFYCLSVLFVPVVTYLFWKRKKIGWILLSVFLTKVLMTMFISSFLNTGTPIFADPSEADNYKFMRVLERFIEGGVFGGVLLLTCKRSVREVFKITSKTMVLTIFSTLALFVLYALVIFNLY